MKLEYSGYLKEHLPLIYQLHDQGESPMDIARKLYAVGARSPYGPSQHWDGEEKGGIYTMSGIVRHILGLNKKKIDIPKLEKRVARLCEELRTAQELLRQAKTERAYRDFTREDAHFSTPAAP